MSAERYFSVDIESAGPIPGKYSMLSVGACVVGAPDRAFYAELRPISMDAVPAALEVSQFDLAQLAQTGESPVDVMNRFRTWILAETQSFRPVFVGFNATYDWQFVNWYFHTFCGDNPFGFGGVDIKSYHMGKCSLAWGDTTSSKLPTRYQPETPQTHNALDDARAQASIFRKLLVTSPEHLE